MKIFMLGTSLSATSINKKLILFLARILTQEGHEVTVGSFSDYNAPLYNINVQESEGIPQNVQKFATALTSYDCIIFSCPEYNYSISGVFKNLIDWSSRTTPNPWKAKPIFLMSASPSSIGGMRGLWATRIPLEGLGAYVAPGMFSLPDSYKTLSNEGQITDANLVKQLHKMKDEFLQYAAKLNAK